MKKDNRNLIISLIAVAMIIVLAGGGTYAWLTWRSATNQQTNINVSVSNVTTDSSDTQNYRFNIDGGGNITSGKIAPTDQCNHSTYGIKRTINIDINNPSTTPFLATLQLQPITFPTVYANTHLRWVLSTSSTDCTTAANIVGQGNFGSATQGTKFTLTTFDVAAGSQSAAVKTTKTYYLYIWLDEGYSVENVGNTVTNSMQDNSFTLKVTGEMTNQPS